MERVKEEAAAVASTVAPSWWQRYLRWRQTSKAEAAHAERLLLAQSAAPVDVSDVRLNGSDKHAFMHTLTTGPPEALPIVCMPGYAAGAAFYFRNFAALGQNFRIYAVDWLGTGLSGRPRWAATSREQAEDFFLDSLEAWRKQQKLDKFILLGHSLGGYLAATYALRHPDVVQHLIMVCPAGVPTMPEGWESRFAKHEKWTVRSMYSAARYMWTNGTTPGSLLRALGPFGPGLVEKYVTARFAQHGTGLNAAETAGMKSFFYHISAQKGSGEYALRHLLAPGAWAHSPLESRLLALKVPVTFIYGETDWMNPAAGQRVCKELDEVRARKVASDHECVIIPDSGHFCFMEQPKLFNDAVIDACKEYLKGKKAATPPEAGKAAASSSD